MSKRKPDAQPERLTQEELGAYLLWRYNLPGYAESIAQWRNPEPDKPTDSGADEGAATQQET